MRRPERRSVTNGSYTILDSEIVLVLKNENETETGQDLLAERNNDANSSPIASSSALKNQLTESCSLNIVLHENLSVFKNTMLRGYLTLSVCAETMTESYIFKKFFLSSLLIAIVGSYSIAPIIKIIVFSKIGVKIKLCNTCKRSYKEAEYKPIRR